MICSSIRLVRTNRLHAAKGVSPLTVCPQGWFWSDPRNLNSGRLAWSCASVIFAPFTRAAGGFAEPQAAMTSVARAVRMAIRTSRTGREGGDTRLDCTDPRDCRPAPEPRECGGRAIPRPHPDRGGPGRPRTYSRVGPADAARPAGRRRRPVPDPSEAGEPPAHRVVQAPRRQQRHGPGRPRATGESCVDGIGAPRVFPEMLDLAGRLLDGSLVVSVEEAAVAVRLMAERNHMIAEGAGAVPVAAALVGSAGGGNVVCVVSGGNIDSAKLATILEGGVP